MELLTGVLEPDSDTDKKAGHLHGNSTGFNRLFCVLGGCNGKIGVLQEDERISYCRSTEVSVESSICTLQLQRKNQLIKIPCDCEVNWNCTLICGFKKTEVLIAGKLMEEKKLEGKGEVGTSVTCLSSRWNRSSTNRTDWSMG